MDQGEVGPVEVMLLHRASGTVARPSWERRFVFDRSWHATMFIIGTTPPPRCEWIKVSIPFVPRITFGDLLRRANASIPHLDPAPDAPSTNDKRLKNLLLEL